LGAASKIKGSAKTNQGKIAVGRYKKGTEIALLGEEKKRKANAGPSLEERVGKENVLELKDQTLRSVRKNEKRQQ